MSSLTIDKAGPLRKIKYGSMSRDRGWALRQPLCALHLSAALEASGCRLESALSGCDWRWPPGATQSARLAESVEGHEL